MQLTEAETEYVVRCVKHTFAGHLVFQFDCTNTLNDQLLQRVMVQMEPSEAYEVMRYVPAANLPYSQPGSCYTLVRLPEDDPTAGQTTRVFVRGIMGVLCGVGGCMGVFMWSDQLFEISRSNPQCRPSNW